MAFFGVTLEEIETISVHPNADKLELGKLKGLSFQFVVPKYIYKQNDKVLYFPIDSLIPVELLKKMGLEGKLSGKNKNRVKTIKLRDQISQGIVASINLIEGLTDLSPESITSYLGVTKFEPEAVMEKGANLLPLPNYLSMYDIEGCDRYESVVNELMNEPVIISEKVEGSNFSISFNGEKLFVNQRRYTIEEIDGCKHSFWEVARNLKLTEKVVELYHKYNNVDKYGEVTIYGEFLGPSVQGNIYKFPQHKILVFDIKVGNRFVSAEEFINITTTMQIETVPILANNVVLKDWLNGKSIQESSNGISVLFNCLREGIVIKPMESKFCRELSGRLILKQRSPEYLNKTDN